jgi:hypothetical protein
MTLPFKVRNASLELLKVQWRVQGARSANLDRPVSYPASINIKAGKDRSLYVAIVHRPNHPGEILHAESKESTAKRPERLKY